MNKFIEYYNKKFSTPEGKENSDKKIENVNKALDRLNEEFDDDVKIKQFTLPFAIYGMYRDSKSTSKYIEWLKNFRHMILIQNIYNIAQMILVMATWQMVFRNAIKDIQ